MGEGSSVMALNKFLYGLDQGSGPVLEKLLMERPMPDI